MNDFLSDYFAGKTEGRYLDPQLPELPFSDLSFDLALCSHFLFLYSAQLGEKFHVAAVLEMCRVAKECRIFPLLALDGRRSELVQPVLNAIEDAGFEASLEKVPYEFQRGNQMMRICRKPTCSLHERSRPNYRNQSEHGFRCNRKIQSGCIIEQRSSLSIQWNRTPKAGECVLAQATATDKSASRLASPGGL